MVAFVVLLLFWLGCGFYAGTTSSDKGHSGGAWLVGGLLFGPIALIAAAGLGDLKQRRYLRLLAESQGVDVTAPQSSGDVAQDIIKQKRGY